MVRTLFEQALALAGDKLACGHVHDTRGLGLANVYAAWKAGARRFDACVAGMGGCPHAPGASGNVATEDVAYLFASMGVAIGLVLPRLLALRAAVARRLAAGADVVAENFKPGALRKFGLDYAALAGQNERLIYVSHKGFLPGPYEHRTALDEVVQMMGGLAYMTGRPGDPLRAGTSVNDIMGGPFGAIGALGALIQRGITGRGMEVQSVLYENDVFLMGQHMLQYAMTGRHPAPMPARDNPWAVYDVFTVRDGEQIFLAAVSDAQWGVFCDVLGFADLKADPALATNNDRVKVRPQLLATLRARLADRGAGELAALFERAGLPFAPIRRPEDLFDDPHLRATGGLADVVVPDGDRAGQVVKTTLFPITLDGARLGVHLQPPRMGEHTDALLRELGYGDAEIERLRAQAAVA